MGRVGGLAAALGAGAVIGLATAGPASAAPAESASESGSGSASGSAPGSAPAESASESASGSGSATGDSRPASSRRSAAGQAGRAAGRPARPVGSSRPTGTDPPRPAAGLTAAQREVPVQRAAVSASALLAVAPKPAAPAASPAASRAPDAPVSTVPVQPAAAVQVTRRAQRTVQRIQPTAIVGEQASVAATGRRAAAGGPIAGFIKALFPCDPRGRLITIYKGTHFAIPNSFGFFIKEVSGTGTFTADTVYDLKDEDQFDWNKFTGIAFTPLEPDRDSVMVGWRYNLVTEEFEIAPFYNVDKIRILPEQAEVISVPADQTFQFDVDYSGVTLTYADTSVYKPFPPGLTANVWTAARVSGWFGGNEVAPRTVSYYLRLD